MRRAAGILVLAVVAVPACGRVTGRAPPAPEDAPAVARIVCEPDGTRLLTPTVRPQPDGVHIIVEDQSGEDSSLAVDGIGGGNASGEQAWPIPPGSARVGCWALDAEEPDYREIEVVDPEGLYVPAELDCAAAVGGSGGAVASSGGLYAEAPKGDPRDVVVIAREFFEKAFGPLSPEDRVERAGYPEAEIRHVRLVREGRTIAVANYADASFAGGKEGSGWIDEGYEACSDA